MLMDQPVHLTMIFCNTSQLLYVEAIWDGLFSLSVDAWLAFLDIKLSQCLMNTGLAI